VSKKRRHVICDYCQERAEKVDAVRVYPHRPDLAGKKLWMCVPCDAWVGCHRGTTKPLGRLADAELRKAKQSAHAAFDRLWKAKAQRDGIPYGKARGQGYAWLSQAMGVPPKKCHIGMFDVDQCCSVVELCRPFHAEQREAA
jgi:Fe-S cluster biosynthesis and repair protein YggX